MILEGLVTTLGPGDALNIAPMGPLFEGDWSRFVLRPFQTSTTFRNLKARGEGVLHITDDVLLLAHAAIGPVDQVETRPADVVHGRILLTSARYHEFHVIDIDESEERATIRVETVGSGRLRDLFGLNRAKHAVVEAAILATRIAFLPGAEVRGEFDRLRPLVAKTGGEAEREAFALLERYIAEAGDRA
jgi:uncharacterized protein